MFKIRYAPFPSQREVFFDDTTKYLLHSAGLSAGKTYNMCMKVLKMSYLNQSGAHGVLVPAYSDFSRDVYPTMTKISEENGLGIRYNKQDKTFKLQWSQFPIYVFTAEKPISGPNLCGGVVNEFSLIPYERIKEFLRRMRVVCKYPQMVLTGTPEDRFGWLEEFVEIYSKRPSSEFKIIYGSSTENTCVDKDYVKDLTLSLDDQSLKVFMSGQIVRIGGNYFYYSFDRKKNIGKVDFQQDQIIHCGMDFNVGKMAATFSHKIGDMQLVFDEMFLRGDSNTRTMCRAIKEKFPFHWKDKMIVTCDAAGNARKSAAAEKVMSDVAVLRSEGFSVRFKSANTRLRKRQIQMNAMLYHAKIILDEKCKHTIRDLEKLQQMPDYTKDDGNDGLFGHLSDTLDYVIDYEHKSLYDISRTKISLE